MCRYNHERAIIHIEVKTHLSYVFDEYGKVVAEESFQSTEETGTIEYYCPDCGDWWNYRLISAPKWLKAKYDEVLKFKSMPIIEYYRESGYDVKGIFDVSSM